MDDINFSLWLNLFFFHCVQTYLLHITLKDSILGKKKPIFKLTVDLKFFGSYFVLVILIKLYDTVT